MFIGRKLKATSLLLSCYNIMLIMNYLQKSYKGLRFRCFGMYFALPSTEAKELKGNVNRRKVEQPKFRESTKIPLLLDLDL